MVVFFLRLSAFGMLFFLAAFLVWPKTFLVGEPTTYAAPISSLPLTQQRPMVIVPRSSFDRLERLEISLHPTQGPARLESLDLEITSDCSLSLAMPLDITRQTEVFLRPTGPGCADIVPDKRYTGWARTNSTVPLWVPTTRAGHRQLTLLDEGIPWAVWALWVEKKGFGSRLNALAGMWDLPVWALSLGLLTALIPAGLGLRLLSGSVHNGRKIIISGLLALTPVLVIALITPPFHAPDENNHFYSFAKLNGDPELLKSGMDLGENGHFARIRSDRTEIFTISDATTPPNRPMIMHDSHQVSTRSAIVTGYWRVLGKLIPSSQANIVLWGVRWLNAFVYGFAVILGTWLLQRSSPQLHYPIFLFAVPALPFFAMHLSNHALVPGLCVIMACLSLGLLYKKGNWPLAGPALGLICAIAFLTTRSLIGMAVGAVFLVLPVPFLAAGRTRKEAVIFWGGLLVGLSPLFLVWNHPQVSDLVMVGRGVLEHVLPGMSQVITLLTSPLAVVAAVALAYALERILGRIYVKRKFPDWTFMRWALPPIVIFFAIIMYFGIQYDYFSGFPSIENRRRPALLKYFSRAVCSFFTGFSPRKPTFFLQTSFWGGFSWLEALLPEIVVRSLGTISGTGFILFCVRLWKRRDGPQTMMLIALLAATVAALLATAFGAYSTKMNLHGRYLLGVYLFFLAPAFAGFAPPEGKQILPVRLALSAGVCLLTAAAVSGPLILLERFFGCDTLYTLLGHRLG